MQSQSTIVITKALKDACIELLTELGTRAEDHALEVDYHVVSVWVASVLANPNHLSAAAVAAQTDFKVYEINERWLEVLHKLIAYGGTGVDGFMLTLCRYYLFNLEKLEEPLWEQYNVLKQQVFLETGTRLPDTWGEWDGPMRAFMGLFVDHLRDLDGNFDLLFGTPTARELAEEVPPIRQLPELPGDAITRAPVSVDNAAALTTYLEWCLEMYGHLDVGGSQPGERFGLRLEDVFVPRNLQHLNDWARVRGYARYQCTAGRWGPHNNGFSIPNGRGPHRDPLPPIKQLLDEAMRLLVLAGPGEGKTTLLRHLALQHARLILDESTDSSLGQRALGGSVIGPDKRVPIYLHVADYAEKANLSEETLLDYILRSLAEQNLYDPGIPAMLWGLLETGKCLILLDGLDAVQGSQQRRLAAARISQLAEEWCGSPTANRVLVASRSTGYESAPLSPDFEAYLLAPLTPDESGQALMRWALATERARRPMLPDDALQNQGEQVAIDIVREISRDETLRSMASNPLLLRIMAEQHSDGAYLPPQRVALVRAAAESMIREWRLARGPTRSAQVQEAEVTELLSHLAYWLHSTRGSGMAPEREVAKELCRVWLARHPEASDEDAREAIADFLAKVRHHGGLLAELRPRHYGFAHPCMQEYFAARYLVARYRIASERIRLHLHDPRWDEVVRMAIGFVSLDSLADASDLLETAVLARPNGVGSAAYPSSPFEDMLKRDLLLAASLLGDGIEASREVTRYVVHQLVDLWLLGDRDSAGHFDLMMHRVRQRLMALDGTVAGQVAMQYALGFAQDERPEVRAFLADGLTFWSSDALLALQTLVDMGGDISADVRRAVAEAMGRMSSMTTDAQVLLLKMVSDADVEVRKVARHALSQAGPVPDEAMRVWVRLLHDADPGRRQLGAKVLQRVGTLSPVIVGELLGMLSDEDSRVRNTVAKTLATVNQLPDNALLAICRAINEARPGVQAAAIEALARPMELPDNVVSQLLNWSRASDPRVRLAATRALDVCHNRTEVVISGLMDRTDDEETLNVRQLAIEALGRKGVGDKDVAHHLLHYGDDPNLGIKMSTARALGYLGDLTPDGERVLESLLGDFHAGVREAAMWAAAQLGRPYASVVQHLVDLTGHENPSEVLEAARTLAAIDGLPTEALMALVSLLPAHTGELADALKACLKRHSPLTSEVVHPLMDLASGGPPETRHLAIDVLGESLHRVPGIQEKLLELAHDPEVTVRAAAIHSLGLARDLSDYALNELFDLLDGEPLPVRQAVAVTLAKLSRSLPQLGWTERRLQALADRLYRLLREIPPRAAWEPDVDGQNKVFEALSWLSPRYRPDV